MSTFQTICKLCSYPISSAPYFPVGTHLGAEVFTCEGCGVVQTSYSRPRAHSGRIVSISCDADWGNIRHGKSLRSLASVAFIKSVLGTSTTDVKTVLDIGANRGSFAKIVHELFPNSEYIFAIEPDSKILDWSNSEPLTHIECARFENVELKESSFDFAYSSHTLEHADCPLAMLAQTNRALRDGGLHFLEVPNLFNICDQSNVEEFFIDKHTFHFSRESLELLVAHAGFEIVSQNPESDLYNITYLLRKVSAPKTLPLPQRMVHEYAAHVRSRLSVYSRTLSINRLNLRVKARKIEELSLHSNVALWGGGRVFDALVRYGNLDVSKVCFMIDSFITPYVNSQHTLKYFLPENNPRTADSVVVLARSSSKEIADSARKIGLSGVLFLSDL